MVIDSSVLIAILLGEPDRELFKRAINKADVRLVSAMTKLERTWLPSVGSALREPTSWMPLCATLR